MQVQKPTISDFSLAQHNHADAAGGGTLSGSSGHVIQNAGTPLTARANMNVTNGLQARDDSGNSATIVEMKPALRAIARIQASLNFT